MRPSESYRPPGVLIEVAIFNFQEILFFFISDKLRQPCDTIVEISCQNFSHFIPQI